MSRSSARIGVLIQARMSSQRLPGKMLRLLAGRPLVQHVWERCRQAAGADLVAIVTSREASDDPIEAWADQAGATLFRGPLDDVASRFLLAAELHGLDAFVRTNGDSPLIDPALLDLGIITYRAGTADLVTNVLRRTFPVGMSVEVVDRPTFARACAEMETDDDREHVTRFYYRRPERFRIESFESSSELGDRSLAVDTAADLARLEDLFGAMDRAVAEYDCAALCALAARIGVLQGAGKS